MLFWPSPAISGSNIEMLSLLHETSGCFSGQRRCRSRTESRVHFHFVRISSLRNVALHTCSSTTSMARRRTEIVRRVVASRDVKFVSARTKTPPKGTDASVPSCWAARVGGGGRPEWAGGGWDRGEVRGAGAGQRPPRKGPHGVVPRCGAAG